MVDQLKVAAEVAVAWTTARVRRVYDAWTAI